MEDNWSNLYEKLLSNVKSQIISPFVKLGGTYCLIETTAGKNYIGTDINTSGNITSSITNAINQMLTYDQNITKIILINELGEIVIPQLNLLEPILELCQNYEEISILISLKPLKTSSLAELLPVWWGIIKQK